MNRRRFLESAAVFPALARAAQPARWRVFEVTTRVEIPNPEGAARVWVPAALGQDTPYQRTLSNTVHCDGGVAKTIGGIDGLSMVGAFFPPGTKPSVTLVSRVATTGRSADFLAPRSSTRSSSAQLAPYLAPTRFIPTGGIVRERAVQITRGAATDLAKARAIYEWIVDNTHRDPAVRGCGRGDIRFMLKSGDLGGKCADLNALYVSLARAAGLPARDVYGIRVAPSELGYESLGASSNLVTKAQHCRAEVYLEAHGWIAVDPADVRKVMLEEPPGNRPASDPMVRHARARLFGSWEMNWMAYNFAHDVALPGSGGPPLAFFMYPQAETARGRLDCLDPEHFRYEITARELPPEAA